jgi:colanic acid/amylovoran biosynthesis glycosyltransferase
MNKMVHLVSPYLFNTGSWVYSQINNISEFESHIFTSYTENLDHYPYEKIIAGWEFSEPKKFLSRLWLKCFNRQGLFFKPYHMRISPVVYQAHMGFEGVRWLNFIKSTQTPLVTTFYGQDVSKLGRIPYWQKKYRELFNYGSLFLAEGNSLRDKLIELGCPPEKAIVQHLGVDLNKYTMNHKRTIEDKIIIFQSASYKAKKGYYYSLKAIKELSTTHDNFEFRIVGSGNAEEVLEMERWIREIGIGGKVHLLGSLPHQEYLNELVKADIFLHPSVTAPDGDSEGGSPVGNTEATAMNIPVVASLHAYIPEVVIHVKSGIHAPDRDIIKLAEYITI